MILLSCISIFEAYSESGKAGGGKYSYSSLGVNLRPSYVVPTHGFYNGNNPAGKPIRLGGAVDLQYFIMAGERAVYQGLGVSLHTFFSHDLVGTPATLYIFQGAPVARLSEHLTVGYEWNLGISSGWKVNHVLFESPMNIYINAAVLFSWRVKPALDIVFGPEYSHFSNGDTRFPNGGANTVNLRAGIRGYIRPREEIRTENLFSSDYKGLAFRDRISYDLAVLGGWRADRTVSDGTLHIFNKAFPVAGLYFNPMYRFNSFLSAGASLDIMYDSSANLIIDVKDDGYPEYRVPPLAQQMCMGISVRTELKMPVFAVNIGIGYSLQLENHTRYLNDLNALYGVFFLKAFVTERLFLNVSYRLSSVLYANDLMFGLGWRFGTI